MGNEFIVGLDIGTTKIACLIGQRSDDGKIKILGHSTTKSVGVENGVVRNIDLTAKSIKIAVNTAAQQANVQVHDVYVGIAGQHIKSIPSQGSLILPRERNIVTQDDVDRLIREQDMITLLPGEQIIHVFPQTYYIDNDVLSNDISPVGVVGHQLKADFHIVTGNLQNILNIRDSVVAAGYSVKDLVLEPVASALAVLDERDKQAGVALVDIGGGTTDIAIFYEGIIRHTSVIPLAGQAITNDIRRGCSILPDQAESLKVKYGSCLPSNEREGDIVSIPGIRNQPPKEISLKTLAGIIKARVEQILEQVAYEIMSSSYDSKQLIAGLVITGGGASMKYIKELASMITCMDTRIGMPNEHLLAESDAELAHPKYATGIGLVIYGINQEYANCNDDEPAYVPNNFTTEEHTIPANTTTSSSTDNNNNKEQSILDILDNMPNTPRPEPVPEPTQPAQHEQEPDQPAHPTPSSQNKPKGNDNKPKDNKDKRNIWGSVKSFFDQILDDDVD